MVNHVLWGVGPTLLQSGVLSEGQAFPDVISSTSSEIVIRNADGTMTYIYGSSLTYDIATHSVLPSSRGTVTEIKHFAADGSELDTMTNFVTGGTSSNNLKEVFGLLQGGYGTENPTPFAGFLLNSTDVFDARYRAGNAVVDDVFYARDQNDQLFGGSGNDRLFGDRGDDYVNGGTGNDLLVGGNGADYLTGGSGNDKLIAEQLTDGSHEGGWDWAADDQLFGGSGRDLLMGGRGNDILNGGVGIDTAVLAGTFASLNIINWGNGFQVSGPASGSDDWLVGIERIAADDGVWQFNAGTSGWDKISTASGQGLVAPEQIFKGRNMCDEVLAGRDFSAVYTYGGNDSITIDQSASRSVVVFAGAGDDTIKTGGIGGRVYGGAGVDTMQFDAGDISNLVITKTDRGFTVLLGGNHLDYIEGIERIQTGLKTYAYQGTTQSWVQIDGPQPGGTIINGTANNDVILSDTYPDAVEFFGLGGDDTITVNSQQGNIITIHGGTGDDILNGPSSYSGQGILPVTLFGDEGNDELNGGAANDTLNGGAGNDALTGDRGTDTLTGGTGADVFYFSTRGGTPSSPPSSGDDIITDFEVGVDSIGVGRLFPGSTQYYFADSAEGTRVTISDVGTILLQGVHGITQDDLFV